MPISDALQAHVATIPIFKLLHLRLNSAEAGTASMTAPYQRAFDGIFESFHGGLLMTIADTVACFAVLSLTGAEEVVTTTDMSIRFLAACRSDATAEARVIKLGKTLCPVAVDLYDAERRHLAVAQVTYMRLGKRS